MNDARSLLDVLNSFKSSGTPGAKMVDPKELYDKSSAKAFFAIKWRFGNLRHKGDVGDEENS